ncbi:MAG: EamA family transporter [Pseudomonadota bacterium]
MAQYIPLILLTVVTNFLSQIMLKHGMTSIDKFEISADGLTKSAFDILFNPFVVGGLVVMVISMACHLVVLSRVDISYAYPFLGLSFVLTAAWGYFALGEDVNTFRILGVLLICSGVALVAKS